MKGPQLVPTITGEPMGIREPRRGESSGSRAVLGWAQGLAVMFVQSVCERRRKGRSMSHQRGPGTCFLTAETY